MSRAKTPEPDTPEKAAFRAEWAERMARWNATPVEPSRLHTHEPSCELPPETIIGPGGIRIQAIRCARTGKPIREV